MSQPPNDPNRPGNPYNAPLVNPPSQAYASQPTNEGDATGGLIPYKNPKALIAYYVGIASLLCFPLGFVSIILGIMGLRDRKQNPVIKGSVHAWIGIVCGACSILCVGGVILAVVIGG